MLINNKFIINILDIIFFLILFYLILNTILVFSEGSFLGFLGKYNNFLFDFIYLSIFLILLCKYFIKLEITAHRNNIFLIFTIAVFFLLKYSIDSSELVIKDFIQIIILIILWISFDQYNKKILRSFFLLLNIVSIFAIIVFFIINSDFFQTSFFYLFNFNEILLFKDRSLKEDIYNYVVTSNFNHLNIFFLLFFIFNVHVKNYKDSIFYQFSTVFIFLYLLFYSNFYTQISLIFFLIITFFERIKYLKLKNFFLVLIIFIIFSPWITYNQYSLKILKNSFLLLEILEKPKNSRRCFDKNDELVKDLEIKEITNQHTCFRTNLVFHYKSFYKRYEYNKKIINYGNSLIGFKKKELKNLYDQGIFPHNSYLDIYTKFGYLGLFFFGIVIIRVLNNKSVFTNYSPLITIFFTMIFDDYLIGHMFSLSIFIWLIILLTKNYETKY